MYKYNAIVYKAPPAVPVLEVHRPALNQCYQMSWEMYRALEGKTYTHQDRVLDQEWEARQPVQLLVDKPNGSLEVKIVSRSYAERTRKERRQREEKNFLDKCWVLYRELQNVWGYISELSDQLLEMRKNLEVLGERSARHKLYRPYR